MTPVARSALVALLLATAGLTAAVPARAQRERPREILRDVFQGLVPGSPEEAEQKARSTRDAAEALRLYASLQARYSGRPQGVRAAIWIGLYYYDAGDMEAALDYFERARRGARDAPLRSRASFWCEQARRMAGREPLGAAAPGEDAAPWGTLRALVGVDRSIQTERRGEAEAQLLSMEGDARRDGLLGPEVARWGELLRMPGPRRIHREQLLPMLAATAELPERLQVALPPAPAPTPPAEGVWSVQFGAFLNPDNARGLEKDLKDRGIDARTDEAEEDGTKWYRVRSGELSSRPAADSLAARIGEKAGVPYQTVRVR